MSKTANFQDIKNHINNDMLCCQALLELLEAERDALRDRKPEDLENILAAKLLKLQQLESSAQQRSHWVANNDTQGITQEQRWLELIQKTHPQLTPLWQTLQAQFKKCQSENEVNGKILARNQQVFKRILNILRGQGEVQQDLYTQRGSKRNNGFKQNLGEA